MRDDPLIFLSAGEASGDHYGAELMMSLRERLPRVRFTGLGGTAMEAAGQRRVVRAEDVAVMGITEILRHVPRIVGSYRRLVQSTRTERPDAAVLIDFPDVNFRLARHLKKASVPVLWFVSPQLWAWKRRRLRWVQQRVDRMLTIFPFEEPFYRARGVAAEFVGHPLAEAPLPTVSRQEYAEQARGIEQRQWALNGLPRRTHPKPYWTLPTDPALLHYPLDPAKPWVALLPGSRRGEITANLPTLVDAAKLLGDGYEYLVPLAPGLGSEQVRWMQRVVAAHLNARPLPRITFVHDARAALFHSRGAAVASGTATVQAAMLGTPFVAVYRVSPLTFAMAKRLVRYPHEIDAEPDRHGNLPIVMPNLVAGHRIIPELLQEHFTAEAVAEALRPLLQDGRERRAQQLELAEVRRRLLPPEGTSSIGRLRDAVLQALAGSSATSPRASKQ